LRLQGSEAEGPNVLRRCVGPPNISKTFCSSRPLNIITTNRIKSSKFDNLN